MADLYHEIARTLREVPATIQNGPIFDEIKNVRNNLPIYKSGNQMKLVFIGRSSTGKSTIINALLIRECLPVGSTEVTVSFFTIETTNKDYEYFVVTNRKSGLNASENTNISELKSIRRLNYNVTDFPDIDTIMKIYLDKENEFLKNGVVLVDCPGYDRGHSETIKNLAKDADVFTVVIDINEGCNQNEAGNLEPIFKMSQNVIISFIFNKCDNVTAKDKEKAIDAIKTHFPTIFKIDCTDSEKPVFFLSAKELLPGKLDEYNAEEFERYKKFIQNQIPIAKSSHKKRNIKLHNQIQRLVEKMKSSVPLITSNQYHDREKTKQSRMQMTSSLPDTDIEEIFKKIDETVDANNFLCYKDNADLKVVSICDDINNMITEFLKQLCLRTNEVITIKDGDAVRKAGETFYKTVFVASEMKINDYSWYDSGEKSKDVQKNFKKYLSTNKSNYKKIITSHYKEKVGIYLDHVLQETEEYIEYWEALESLVTQLQPST